MRENIFPRFSNYKIKCYITKIKLLVSESGWMCCVESIESTAAEAAQTDDRYCFCCGNKTTVATGVPTQSKKRLRAHVIPLEY